MLKDEIKEALKYSDYWTWFTEWLLGFGGKAAWPILIICTLYMGAELYPGVNLPGPLNFAVFLAQLFALDMGGMGLVSIARQVKDAGHEEEAKQADSFGKVLVAIVITSLVTVGVKQFLSGIPALITPATKGGNDSIMNTWIEPVIMCVEFILVIARVVCAVLYGKVMHNLKHTNDIPTPPTIPAVTAIDVEEMIRHAVNGLQATFNQSLQVITTEQGRMLAAIQQVQNIPATVPPVDIEAIARAMMPQLRATFQSQARAITEEVQGHVKTMLIESQGQQARPLLAPEPPRQIEARASAGRQSQNHTGQPALTLLSSSKAASEASARANGTPEERLQAAYEVLLKGNARISGRALAKEAHVNRDTASKWLSEVKGQQDEPEGEIVETDCEIEAIAQGQ